MRPVPGAWNSPTTRATRPGRAFSMSAGPLDIPVVDFAKGIGVAKIITLLEEAIPFCISIFFGSLVILKFTF